MATKDKRGYHLFMLAICFFQGIILALFLPFPLGGIAGAIIGFLIGWNADRFGDFIDEAQAEMEETLGPDSDE